MSIRFAAPPARTKCRIPREQARTLYFRPANDNRGKGVDNTHLRAALKHFAQHGLAAADHARKQAVAAADAGDRQTFEWWLEICRALDRRMASGIEPLSAER
ncbi:hypothetical protein OZN62_13880 [Aurantiacibacter sp. MUD11]|uniref:hypothetical protein n=1 Tax=Aurantiacibacter sp. MUD11 TaxID=3003265 RepID=UPI0022AA77DF|nr:hypothetical protein [Aurantiacibacter sp. MUD11]WAT17987.1 hypothetical protein OZN62_13880 [Aurantiacibacter sp. MUD11]